MNYLSFLDSTGNYEQTSEIFVPCNFLTVHCSPFMMLYLGLIGMDSVMSEPCYKWTILQRNYGKMTILWPFSIIPKSKITW